MHLRLVEDGDYFEVYLNSSPREGFLIGSGGTKEEAWEDAVDCLENLLAQAKANARTEWERKPFRSSRELSDNSVWDITR